MNTTPSAVPVRLASAVGLAAALMVLAVPGGAAPDKDPSAEFFRSPKVPHFLIEIAGTNLDTLRRDARQYVRSTVTVDGTRHEAVGVHLKGVAGSFRGLDDKPALTLNFDKFRSGQRFHGLDKIHLNNSVQDPSYLTEILCGEMFLAAGVPAARGAHARVTLNGRDRGLYVLKEGFDKTFLKRHFRNPDGNLYDGGFIKDVSDPLKRDSGSGPEDHADLKALTAAAREPERARRWQALQARLDVDRFLSLMALEIMTCHWDGYACKRNNYRVYHDPDTDRLVFFPHGMDQMFGDAGFPLQPGLEGLVARALMDTPEGRRGYLAQVTNLLQKVFRHDALAARITELQNRVRPAFAAFQPEAARQHDEAVNQLRQRVFQRASFLARQLGQPGPASVKFDAARQFALTQWRTQPAGEADLDQPGFEGRKTLHIRARGHTTASWRASVELPPGRYTFSGAVRTAKLAAVQDGPGEGAGLRLSGAPGPRPNKAVGDTPWTPLRYEFEVTGEGREVVLVCELRGAAGEAWFDLATLKLEQR